MYPKNRNIAVPAIIPTKLLNENWCQFFGLLFFISFITVYNIDNVKIVNITDAHIEPGRLTSKKTLRIVRTV